MRYSPIFFRIYRNVALLHHRTSVVKYGILTATTALGATATLENFCSGDVIPKIVAKQATTEN